MLSYSSGFVIYASRRGGDAPESYEVEEVEDPPFSLTDGTDGAIDSRARIRVRARDF